MHYFNCSSFFIQGITLGGEVLCLCYVLSKFFIVSQATNNSWRIIDSGIVIILCITLIAVPFLFRALPLAEKFFVCVMFYLSSLLLVRRLTTAGESLIPA